jgi:hypothetical protein
MVLAAQLMRMMAAAIVVIAVQFLSLPAQAHSGHVHAHHGMAAHSHTAVTDDGQAQHVHAAQPAELRSADQELPNAAAVGSNCTTGCCGFGVSCCGGTALAVVLDQHPPSARSSSIGLERDAATRGIDPDALRKPPRSLI